MEPSRIMERKKMSGQYISSWADFIFVRNFAAGCSIVCAIIAKANNCQIHSFLSSMVQQGFMSIFF
jgi:hypothetical protein